MTEERRDPLVYVVDDEEAIGDAIALLMKSVGLNTRVYRDPRRFLADYVSDGTACLVADIRMPGLGGMELQKELAVRRHTLPVIFITGHADVPMAVEAMRAGAVDFLQKPFKDDDLIRRVQRALEQDAQARDLLRRKDEVLRRWEELTPRERDVADRIVDGKSNKVVAAECGISERTVEVHRAHILAKMQARSLAQLVQLVLLLRD